LNGALRKAIIVGNNAEEYLIIQRLQCVNSQKLRVIKYASFHLNGDQALHAAFSRVLNRLSGHVTSAPSPAVFPLFLSR